MDQRTALKESAAAWEQPLPERRKLALPALAQPPARAEPAQVLVQPRRQPLQQPLLPMPPRRKLPLLLHQPLRHT